MKNHNFWINVDDYGATNAVNVAVEKLFEGGIIQSTSVITNLLDNNGVEKLKKLHKKGLRVGIHFNLVSGPIITRQMKKMLGSDHFPGKAHWAKKQTPNTKTIKDELLLQHNILSDLKIKPTHVDFHTFFPIGFNKEAWDAYENLANYLNLPFRGTKIDMHYAKPTKPSFGMIKSIVKSIYVNPKLGPLFIKSVLKRKPGSYESDLSLYSNGAKSEKIIKKAINHNQMIELIAHIADPEEKSIKNTEDHKEKSSEFNGLSECVSTLLTRRNI